MPSGLRYAISFVIGGAGLSVIIWWFLLGGNEVQPRTRSLSEADRSPLVADGDRLRHPTLGFSILNPGPSFHEAPRATALMQDACVGAGAQCFAYADTNANGRPDNVLVVSINANIDNLDGYFDSIEAGLRTSAASQQNVTMTTLDKHNTENGAVLEVTFGVTHVSVEAYRLPPQHAPIVVMLMAVVKNEHSLDKVLSSLQ